MTTNLELPTTPHSSEGPENDGFFTDLVNSKPYIKMAFEGFAASGKTFTMVDVAIWLWQYIKSEKPVVYFDTEKAAKFARVKFGQAGVPVLLRESRSPADLAEAMRRCRLGLSDILIADSLTHIWQRFVDDYKKKHKKDRLAMDDWGVIKPTWQREIMDPFVNDPYHFMFTGRAGYEYESEINEQTKKREIFKSGIKMKVEGDTAFEPDILVLMERCEELLDVDNKKVWRQMTVIKDRANLIDGQTFKNPTGEVFIPSIKFVLDKPLGTGGSATPERDGGSLFTTEEDRKAFFRARDIALEKIEGELVAKWPGQSAEAKGAKVNTLELCFGTKSWTQISGMRPADLEAGLALLKDHIAKITLAEKIEADLEAIWPGTKDDAKAEKATALETAFGTKSLTEVKGLSLDVLTSGREGLVGYIREWQTAAAAKVQANTNGAPASDATDGKKSRAKSAEQAA